MANRRAHLPLLLSAAGALALSGTIGAAFAPTLLSYSPIALLVLSPFGRHVVLAAPLLPLVPLLIVTTTRRMLACSVGYALGRTFGPDGLTFLERRYPRAQGLLRALQRLFERAAPVVLFVAPGPLFCALAGATRMPVWLFFPVATTGQALWIGLTYKLGEALSGWVLPILAFFREHMISTTLVFALIALWLWRRDRSGGALRELSRHGAEDPGPS